MVEFDLCVYSHKAIIKAIDDYKEIASFSLAHNDSADVCTLVSSIYETAETLNEFSNYVLELTIAMQGAAE